MASSSSDGPPLSLRPFPVTETRPTTIADFLARVQAQPGGFRDVSEHALREQLLREDGNGPGQDVGMPDAESSDDEDSVTHDPVAAQAEVLRNISIAANTSRLALDFVSLLLSKHNPTQASLTISEGLRSITSIGTMGADKLHEPTTTTAWTKNQAEIAKGRTVMEINKTRDAAEAAAAYLRKEVEAEGKYWQDVVQVRKAGWSLCKMPSERHTLGVRFGFSESAPEFKNNGLAPMRRGDDGTVQLDCGRLGGVSERILVTYEKGGQVVGRSPMPAQTLGDAPLHARVLEARNTIFAQELWYEISREARSLVSYDVRSEGSRLVYDFDETSRILIELCPLGPTPSQDQDLPENEVAQGIHISLHMLLSYAHRGNELWRTRPMPPHRARARGPQMHPLLRPVIARVLSICNTQRMTRYVGDLVGSLRAAGLPSSFTLETTQPALPGLGPMGSSHSSASYTFIRNLLQPPELSTNISIFSDGESSFTIRSRTLLYPIMMTHHNITIAEPSVLQAICAPYREGYPDLVSLQQYLCTAVGRLVTRHYLDKMAQGPSSPDLQEDIQGTSFRVGDWEVKFAIVEEGDTDDAVAADGGMPSDASGLNIPFLVVTGTDSGDARRETRSEAWRAVGAKDEKAKPSLEVFLQQMLGSSP